ncbi:hypothetical protein [Prosthecobacter sp.]|uniref:hypothetical protein n=1 Tax=Prosthecobacter sp. TaxID=1965333 RepID=UPI002ABCD544|nr:hypothetical protein [Prosthecobacter sp.]MDZ4405003.1 hypothetical protein [Prosthecobacter sp.]
MKLKQNLIFVMKRFYLLLALALAAPFTFAQDQKAPFDLSQAQNSELGLPSPMDKLLGLDSAISGKAVNWGGIYKDIAHNANMSDLKAEPNICLALGIRIADGIMAVKARDANALNECASDIEALARKLKVGENELERAKKTRALANKGQWTLVFWEMGCLQVDIMQSLNQKGNEKRRTLIIAAGWLQGVHYAVHVINERYTPALSNFLREPLLVKAMIEEMKALPEATKASPRVAKLTAALNELYAIVNIPLNGSISKEKVQRVNDLSRELSEEFVL